MVERTGAQLCMGYSTFDEKRVVKEYYSSYLERRRCVAVTPMDEDSIYRDWQKSVAVCLATARQSQEVN